MDNSQFGKKGKKLKISLKTKGGSFTVFNGGTTLRSNLFQGYPFSKAQKKLIANCQSEVKK